MFVKYIFRRKVRNGRSETGARDNLFVMNLEWPSRMIQTTVKKALLSSASFEFIGMHATMECCSETGTRFRMIELDESDIEVMQDHFRGTLVMVSGLCEIAMVPTSFPWKFGVLQHELKVVRQKVLQDAKREWLRVLKLEAEGPAWVCQQIHIVKSQPYRLMMVALEENDFKLTADIYNLMMSYEPSQQATVHLERGFNNLRTAEKLTAKNTSRISNSQIYCVATKSMEEEREHFQAAAFFKAVCYCKCCFMF